MRFRAIFLAAGVTGFLALPAAPGAEVLRVPQEFSTIQAALDAAAPGDLVLVAPGVYAGPGNRDLDFRGKDLQLRSAAGAEATVLDCGGTEADPHRGFTFRGGETRECAVAGFTVRNGCAPGDGPGRLRVGGAVSLVASGPTFLDCVFESCAAARGGAIYASESASRFIRCRVRGNAAGAEGGGLYCRGGAAPALERCEFTGNAAAAGGGAYCDGSSPEFSRCLLAGNEAFEGGGAYCILASPEFAQCTFAANRAATGSGLYAYFHSHPVVDRSIVAFGAGGEGLRCGSSGSVAVSCSDVYGNEAGDWTGCVASQAGRDGNFSADPRFCGAVDASGAGASWQLQRGSACLRAAGCGLVGALGQGCARQRAVPLDRMAARAAGPAPEASGEPSSWGALKHRYRAP